jgi:hypothetical protein
MTASAITPEYIQSGVLVSDLRNVKVLSMSSGISSFSSTCLQWVHLNAHVFAIGNSGIQKKCAYHCIMIICDVSIEEQNVQVPGTAMVVLTEIVLPTSIIQNLC